MIDISTFDDILIIDDFFSQEEIENLNEYFLNSFFPWYIVKNKFIHDDEFKFSSMEKEYFLSMKDEKTSEDLYFVHSFIGDEDPESVHKINVNPGPVNKIMQRITNRLNLNFKYFRVKANLQYKNKNSLEYCTPHIDSEIPHLVMLYYVNDSDAHTYIFQNTKAEKPWKLKRKIQTKAGRIVIFNGKHFHAGETPKKSSYRIIINFDIGEINERNV